MLPIASWERRFIQEQQLIDIAEGDDTGEGKVEIGSTEDGGGGSADGVYSMMLISSTHHRFPGLFTIQKSGASPVTQLLVRGSPAKSTAVSLQQQKPARLWLWAACADLGVERGAPTLAKAPLATLAFVACRLARGEHGSPAHVLDQLHGVPPLCMPV